MFIDIHSHLLPGVDDGAQSIDESLRLIEQAVDDGIEYIVLTPHFIKNGEFKLEKKELLKRYINFKSVINDKKLNINLFLGNELYIHDELDDLLIKDSICSINATSYILIEFPFTDYKNEYDETLYNISLSGYKIIIAHPERYQYVRDNIDFCKRWIKEGYLLQCNQNSLFNGNEKLVVNMIKKGYVSFIASDAHNEYRPCLLSKAYEKIKNKFSIEIAADLFFNNQLKILKNESI